MLQIESGSMGERMALKRKELESAVEKVKEIVHPYVDGLDENTIELLIQRKTSLRGFVSDSGRVANVEKVVKYLADADYMSECFFTIKNRKNVFINSRKNFVCKSFYP